MFVPRETQEWKGSEAPSSFTHDGSTSLPTQPVDQCFFQDFLLTTVEKIASFLKKLPKHTRPPLKMKKSSVLGHLKMKNVIF